MIGLMGLLSMIVFQAVRITIELSVLAARATTWLVIVVVIPLLRLTADAVVALASAIAHRAADRRTGS